MIGEATERASDAFVFFGATGDLAYKQVFPALATLTAHNRLDMPVIGIANAGWDRNQLVKRAQDSLAEHGSVSSDVAQRLYSSLRYVDGREPRPDRAHARDERSHRHGAPV